VAVVDARHQFERPHVRDRAAYQLGKATGAAMIAAPGAVSKALAGFVRACSSMGLTGAILIIWFL
jgi:hypothetical protein